VKVVLWGAGGHATVVADILAQRGMQIAAVVDRDLDRLEPAVLARFGSGIEAMTEDELEEGWLRDRRLPAGAEGLVLAIGDGRTRLRHFDEAAWALRPVLVHPDASVSPRARLEDGVVVVGGAVVNAQARVAGAAIVNTGATVGHDVVIGRGAHVAPGVNLCGAATVGEQAWIGAGAVVVQGVRIGDRAVVGAGSVVLRDVPPGVVVAGSPARVIRQSRE